MKEAVVFVSQHRNEYYSRSKVNENARFRSFGSPPCRGGFKDIKFTDFQSSVGLLPIPIKGFPASVTKNSFSPLSPSPSLNEPKNTKKFAESDSVPTPIKVLPNEQSFSPKTPSFSVEEPKNLKKFAKSSNVLIPIKINADFNEMSYSERWAGPTYSNSPSPSSLPIPKFSSRPKRTVSLDLPSSSAPSFKFFSLPKSAPASPNRYCDSPFSGDLRNSDESATKTLRRILNLDTADEV